MLIYIADDEPFLLEELYDVVTKSQPTATVRSFEWAEPLLNKIRTTKEQPDIAFLDVEMPGMSGMEVAQALKVISPNTRIVFVTGFVNYAVEAFSIHADGYIMKPITVEKISAEIAYLTPILRIKKEKRITAKCFGNFGVYIDGKQMTFQYSKTKELFAYLIARNGILCTNGEIMAVLWEDEKKESYLRQIRSDLKKQLEKFMLGNVLVQQRGVLGIATEEIDCDYYQWLKDEPGTANLYQGEFMNQFTWAEIINGNIAQK